MLIIGERINATRSRIARAMQGRDAALIMREAKKQAAAGAHVIDVNAGSDPAREIENLVWAVQVVQDAVELPLCIDSAGPDGFKAALKVVKGADVMLNSVNGERERMDKVFPIAAEANAKLVGLLMDERGLPRGVDDRLEIAGKIVKGAEKAGIGVERLYIDPCVQPISTNPDQAVAVIESVRKVMKQFPGIHTTGGLSNIGFGLPYRAVLNRTFITLLIEAGLDSAIIDPTEPDMVATILGTEALCGKDEWCMNYITAEREGRLRPKED